MFFYCEEGDLQQSLEAEEAPPSQRTEVQGEDLPQDPDHYFEGADEQAQVPIDDEVGGGERPFHGDHEGE